MSGLWSAVWWSACSMSGKILFSVVSIGLTTLEGPKVKKHLPGTSRLSIVRTKFYSLCREEQNWSLLIQPVRNIFAWRGKLKLLFSNLVMLEWAIFCNIILASSASALKKWPWSKSYEEWSSELESGRKTCPLSTRKELLWQSCALAISIIKSKEVPLKIIDINLLLDFLVEGGK